MAGHAIGDEGAGNAFLHQLPRRQPRTLQVRTRFIRYDRNVFPLAGTNHAQGGSVARGRERAGIAMSHDARPVGNQLRAELAHRAVGSEVLVVDGAGLGFEVLRLLHALQCPEEIDRGRPGAGQALDGDLDVGQQPIESGGGAGARGEDDAEGGGDADGRRAADGQRADGVGDVLPAPVHALELLPGQEALIEEDEPVMLPADGGDRGRHRSIAPHQRIARRSHSSMSALNLKLCALPSCSTRPSRLKPSLRVSPLSHAPPA